MDGIRIDAALRQVEDTDSVVIRPGAIECLPGAIRELWQDPQVFLVADPNTWTAAGEAACARLESAGVSVERFIFEDRHLHADFENVERLRGQLQAFPGVPLAVGSGTLNDLVKLASGQCGKRYGVVATAASMDGYSSYGASITQQGIKQTFMCRAPRLVLADTDVLVTAPPSMTAAGYADLLAKTTAGADWMLAAALDIEPIHETAWSFIQPPLSGWTNNPKGIATGDPSAVTVLLKGLVMAGLGMQAARSSRPASGAEHLFSHLWDMQDRHCNGCRASHGFKVGVGTLATAQLYAFLQTWDGVVDVESVCERWPDRKERIAGARRLHAQPHLVEAAGKAVAAKHISRNDLQFRLARLQTEWPGLKERLDRQVPAVEVLREKLQAAGAPVESDSIGVDRDGLRTSYLQAATIRDRFTILDLMVETDLLEKALSGLFTPGR